MRAPKGRLFFWLRLLLSIGLVAFLLYTVDIGAMAELVAQGNAAYLLIAFAVAMADRVLMAYKWRVLLLAKQIRIPLLPLTGTYLTSTFLGLFLPATVGADALRAYAVSKQGHRMSDVVSSILVERLLGIAALLVCVLASIVLSVFVFGQSFFGGIWNLFWVVAGVLALMFAFFLLSVNRTLMGRLRTLLQQRGFEPGRSKIASKLREVYRSYMSYQDAKRALGAFVALSVLENMLPVLMNYYIARAFNIDVSLMYFLILTPIVLVLVRLPISLDGIGIHQGAFVYFLALIGVAGEPALLLSVASHAMALASVLPGGLLYLLNGLHTRSEQPAEVPQEVVNPKST